METGVETGLEAQVEESLPTATPVSPELADTPWPLLGNDPQRTGRSSFTASQVPDEIWSPTTAGGQLTSGLSSSPAIGADGTVYFGSVGNRLYAFNSDGSLEWSYATAGTVRSSSAISSDGTIYVGSDDKKLHAINPEGSSKWRFRTEGPVNSSPTIADEGTIYIGSDDNKLYAINPDGTESWTYHIEGAVSSPAIGADGTIYAGYVGEVASFSPSVGALYAFRPNGALKWRMELDPYSFTPSTLTNH